jgi:hypothetical protein
MQPYAASVTGTEILEVVYQWLPTAFALDLLVSHLTGEHPLALTWWWRRQPFPARPLELV